MLIYSYCDPTFGPNDSLNGLISWNMPELLQHMSSWFARATIDENEYGDENYDGKDRKEMMEMKMTMGDDGKCQKK